MNPSIQESPKNHHPQMSDTLALKRILSPHQFRSIKPEIRDQISEGQLRTSDLGNSEFRGQKSEEGIDYRVSGKDFRVAGIPPGHIHFIKKVGNSDMVVLFWACEIFDREKADTCFEEV